jgi:hypothetical protein
VCDLLGDRVTYFPAYEIATRHGAYGPDRRHVTPETVTLVLDAFEAAHGEAA